MVHSAREARLSTPTAISLGFLAASCLAVIHHNLGSPARGLLSPVTGVAAGHRESVYDTPRIDGGEDNPLWNYFKTHDKGPVIDKWLPYFDVYDRYFRKFKGRESVTMLEIGIQSGGTIGMWRSYFGDGLKFYGVDINPYDKLLFEALPRVTVFHGDQSNRTFWRELQNLELKFDIILDDGGHFMDQQIFTFEETWPLVRDGGIYICEDMSTSFDVWDGRDSSAEGWGGGYKRKGTWAEYSKSFVDLVNGNYIRNPDFDPLGFHTSVVGAAFYDQMVVLEKGLHGPAGHEQRGSFWLGFHAATPDPANPMAGVDPELLAEYQDKLKLSLLQD